jgi:hypothetical protein
MNQGAVSFFGPLNCLASLAQSGAITYQVATNPAVAQTAIAANGGAYAPGGAFSGTSTGSLLLIGLVIFGGYLLLRK